MIAKSISHCYILAETLYVSHPFTEMHVLHLIFFLIRIAFFLSFIYLFFKFYFIFKLYMVGMQTSTATMENSVEIP